MCTKIYPTTPTIQLNVFLYRYDKNEMNLKRQGRRKRSKKIPTSFLRQQSKYMAN